MKKYRVVAFNPEGIKQGVFSSKGVTADRQMEDVMNALAQEGWTFFAFHSLQQSVSAGCLAGIFGKKEGTVFYNVLMFEKDM